MKQLNLDLGQTNEERYGSDSPVGPDKDRTYYPEFSYDDDEDDLDIPDKGKMLIEYEEVSRTETTRGDKEHYHCTIAVKKILSVEGKKDERPAKSDTSAGDALDKIAKALEDANESDEDDE